MTRCMLVLAELAACAGPTRDNEAPVSVPGSPPPGSHAVGLYPPRHGPTAFFGRQTLSTQLKKRPLSLQSIKPAFIHPATIYDPPETAKGELLRLLLAMDPRADTA